jgi:hypothetical protein
MKSKKQVSKKTEMVSTTQKKSCPSCSTLKEPCVMTATSVKVKPSKTKTKIVAKFDCGFSNELFIRGEGISALSWDKGTSMKNISPTEWMWESDRPCSTIQFKVLVNDNHFEQGENHTIAFGQEIEVIPKF